MVELRNIVGSDAVDVFPCLQKHEYTFVNKDLSLEPKDYEFASIKSLTITNTGTGTATVFLSIYEPVENSDGVASENEYFLIHKVELPLGASLTFDEYELCVFNMLKHGLRVRLTASDQSVSVLYKIQNYAGTKRNAVNLVELNRVISGGY